MSKEHLIPLGKDPVYDAKVRAKIKGSSSPKRKMGQQIRRIKEKIKENPDDADEHTKRLLEIVRNPEVSALKIQEVIMDTLENENLKPRTKVELIGKMVQAHTAIHGSTQKNLNVNVDTTLDKMIDRLKDYKKQEKIEIVKDGAGN